MECRAHNLVNLRGHSPTDQTLARGRVHGVSRSEVVGTIASTADIPGYVIGKILILDQHTLIDVPEEYVSRVLGQTGAYNFREYQNVTIERA